MKIRIILEAILISITLVCLVLMMKSDIHSYNDTLYIKKEVLDTATPIDATINKEELVKFKPAYEYK